MGETVGDARPQIMRDPSDQFVPQVPPDDVAPQGEREAGLPEPPVTHVRPQVQAVVAICELALVN